MINPQESIQTRQLEALKIGMYQYLDPFVVDRMDIEQVSDELIHLGASVAFRFKKDLWADKLADERQTVTQKLEVITDYTTWESAWQLWKHNHRGSKLFGWIARKWPPVNGMKTRIENREITAEFDIKKYLTFPEFQPPPQQFGNYYRYVQTTPGRMVWDD